MVVIENQQGKCTQVLIVSAFFSRISFLTSKNPKLSLLVLLFFSVLETTGKERINQGVGLAIVELSKPNNQYKSFL